MLNCNDGRTVIITGAAQGIGLSVAKIFIENGDFVAITDINEEKAHESAHSLGQLAKGYKVDVTDEENIKLFVDNLIKERGTIDVLINNAGMQHIDKVENFPLERWNQLIAIMLTGTFLMTKHVLPVLKDKQQGTIINISSAHGKVASPLKSAYVAAKHGVEGFTKVVALETAAFGITANTIMPGPVETRLIKNQLPKIAQEENLTIEDVKEKFFFNKQAIKRFIEPEEIGGTALFLASEYARSITGESISVSGGI